MTLIAARSGEVRGADWSEVDCDNAIWIIPAERMKSTKPHRVPLPYQALDVLQERLLHGPQRGLIFFSRPEKQLSDMTLTKVLRDHKVKSSTLNRYATAHGFHFSFRDWASEHQYSRDLAERALAHSIKNKVKAAYHRTDLLDQRRPMMEHWASFLFQS